MSEHVPTRWTALALVAAIAVPISFVSTDLCACASSFAVGLRVGAYAFDVPDERLHAALLARIPVGTPEAETEKTLREIIGSRYARRCRAGEAARFVCRVPLRRDFFYFRERGVVLELDVDSEAGMQGARIVRYSAWG